MAVFITMINMTMLQQHVEVTQTLPGFYCRTQISE